jgi:hypothetical protein
LHATGDYAFWLDADDIVEPVERVKLLRLFAGLKRPSTGGMASAMLAVTPPLTRPAGDLSPAGRGDNQWPAPQAVPALGDGSAMVARSALGVGLPTPPSQRPKVSPPGSRCRPVDDGATAYVVRCACAPSPDGKKGTTVVDHVRLFPIRPGVRWAYRVHEQILPSLKRANVAVRWTDLTVRHNGYLDPEVEARKLDRNIRLLKLEVEECPDDPFVLFNLGMSAVERRELPEALAYLKRSLAGSAATDSRKTCWTSALAIARRWRDSGDSMRLFTPIVILCTAPSEPL